MSEIGENKMLTEVLTCMMAIEVDPEPSIPLPGGRGPEPEGPREMTAPEHELLSRKIGQKRAAWAFYAHWARAYRHNHPADDRGDFGLFAVFAEEMTAREMKRRESDPKYRHLCQ
jgi:hypothetical protein